jgi:hypothetical protein
MTPPRRSNPFTATTRPQLPAPRGAAASGVHAPAFCLAALCAGSLLCMPTAARVPKSPRSASAPRTPTTAEILAPSATAPADALPDDRVIYRCGNSYSPHPCPNAAPLDVDDPRTRAQRLQAQDVAVRDKRLAAWLEAGRHQRETPAGTPAEAPKNIRAHAAKGCVPSKSVVCPTPRPRRTVVRSATNPASGTPTVAPTPRVVRPTASPGSATPAR